METTNESFNGGTIVVDGKAYRNCVFDGVILQYGGGELPRLIDCSLNNCTWDLVDAAFRTVTLLQGLQRNSGQHLIDSLFPRAPQRNPA